MSRKILGIAVAAALVASAVPASAQWHGGNGWHNGWHGRGGESWRHGGGEWHRGGWGGGWHGRHCWMTPGASGAGTAGTK
jgi:hypothetical protein